METDRFKAFMQLHPSISYQLMEQEAGIPRGTLGHFMRGERGLKPVVYLKLLFKASNYCADPWMIQEAQKLHEQLLKDGKLKNVKFKFKLE